MGIELNEKPSSELPTYHTLLLEIDAGTALVTLNRPAKRNALNQQMVSELSELLSYLTTLQSLRCVIFTGAGGKAFIGGADIGELHQRGVYDALAKINTGLFRQIEEFPMPTIAAVNGFALGGGCEFALACDIRLASEWAKFGQPEVALGIIPGAGATYRLARAVGQGFARELIYTGRIIDGVTAKECGLVNHLCKPQDLLKKAYQIADEISQQSALAVRFAKLTINSAMEGNTHTAMALEATAQAVLFADTEKMKRMGDFLTPKEK